MRIIKKNRSGFTLIELLAVIVILAIIALIATPIIIGVINKARKKAFENTAYGVLEGLKLNYVERILNETSSQEKNFTFPNSQLKLSGEEPAGGNAKITKTGKISFAVYDKDKKWCVKKKENKETVDVLDYNEDTCKIDASENSEITKKYENGTAIYFNPETSESCDEETIDSTPGVKTGCMKWYTFNDSEGETTVDILLDHNTSPSVWGDKLSALANDVSTWDSQIKSTARLINIEEVAQITKKDDFEISKDKWFYFDSNTQNQVVTGEGTSKFAYLFDYLYDCKPYGCNEDAVNSGINIGYWALSTTAPNLLCEVAQKGMISCVNLQGNYVRGVRPIINVSKSLIE